METKCPVCGAPLANGKCEYCGYEEKVEQSKPVQNVTYTQPTPVYVQQPAPTVQIKVVQEDPVSPKSKGVAIVLCIFLGIIGVHRFYVGKIGTGILWLFTAGLFGIGWIVDLIVLICGGFKDGKGLPIKK